MTPELQAYLLWLNKGNPPASQGDAFLGGPVGLPSPFPPYFDVTSPVFGAKGDSNPATDDSVAIQAAIDAAYNLAGVSATIGVYIPDAPVQSGGSQGFYNLKSALAVHHNTHIFGGGMWTTILQFPSDTNGISNDTGDGSESRVNIERLSLIGSAPLSAVATATAGIHVLAVSRWLVRDVYVQDFVDALVIDGTGESSSLHEIHNFWTYNTAYPNATNGYPRYGIHLTGDSSKHIQATRIGGGSTISGNTLNQPDAIYTGDGTTTTFNIQPTGPLWAESGIKVYQIGLKSIITRLVSGVDYNIYDFTTGSNVLIPTGSFGSKSRNVNVIFGTAPANGQAMRIMYNDPTMLIGLYIERGTGNSIELTQIQGAQTLCVDKLGNNSIHVAEIEITNAAYAPVGATASEFTFGNMENSVDTLYTTSSPGATGNTYLISDRGAGWGWTETDATSGGKGSQTYTSGTPAVIKTDATGNGTLQFNEMGRGNREVQIEGTLAFTNSSGGPAEALLTVQVSFDDAGTWATLGQFEASGYCGASSTFYLPFSQTFQDLTNTALPRAGFPQAVLYRTMISLVSGTNVTVVAANAGETYRLRARDVNRPGD